MRKTTITPTVLYLYPTNLFLMSPMLQQGSSTLARMDVWLKTF